MRNNNRTFLLFAFLLLALGAKADWQITGNAIPQGTQAVFTPTSGNTQVWVGKLTNQPFKITDGTTTYVYDCGDNDPLEQTIALREQTSNDDAGLRIRYVKQNQYFRVTLTIDSNGKKITAERLTPPQSMYIMGGPFNLNAGNWLLEDAVGMEQDADNPFVFYYRGDIRYNPIGDLGGSIKFLVGKTWSENYHPAETGGDKPLSKAAKMRLGGEDNKWYIPSDRSGDGFYVIKLNTMDSTISVEQFIHNIDETPLSIFLTGDAMSCGWSNTAPIAMQKKQAGVYQWQGTVGQGLFKFLKVKGSWGMCYVATSADEPIVFGADHQLKYEFEYWNGGGNDYKFLMPMAGEYLFTVNLNTMKIRVEQPATGLPEGLSENGICSFSRDGKLFINDKDQRPLQAFVFSVDGRMVARKAFAGNTEISLAKGCYLVSVVNSGGERLFNEKTLIY